MVKSDIHHANVERGIIGNEVKAWKSLARTKPPRVERLCSFICLERLDASSVVDAVRMPPPQAPTTRV